MRDLIAPCIRRPFASLVGLVCFLGCALGSASQTAPPTHPRVVLITLDGMPARALDDPLLPMPHLRDLIAHGTRAQAMVPINPTVTWPNHTTLITGVDASVHHVMANGLISFPAGKAGAKVMPWVPKDRLVHAPTLYDAAAAAGLTTGQVDWVAIYGAQNVTWSFGEVPDPGSVVAQDLVAQHLVSTEQLTHFSDKSSPAWRDQIWTDAAIDILTHHTPDLTLVHLLETDTLQHQYGPLTSAAYAAYGFADACLGRILDALRSAGIASQTTVIVTADHGFSGYTHVILPNVLLAQKGMAAHIRVLDEGGAAEVFAPQGLEPADVQKLAEAFAAMPGVLQVATGPQLTKLGLPRPGSTDQAPTLYLAARPGYAFSDDAHGELTSDTPLRGAHGYLNSNPEMHAIFVAAGPHIRQGLTLPTFSNLRVAPTIAKLLGISLPTAKEKPLDEMLQ